MEGDATNQGKVMLFFCDVRKESFLKTLCNIALLEKKERKKETGGRKDMKDGLNESNHKLNTKSPANLLFCSVPVSHI